MTPLAISTGAAILAWIGLALGLVVAVVVVALFNRVMRPLLEIEDYAEDIQEAIDSIGANLEDADQIVRTGELGAGVPGLAVAYLEKVKGDR